MRYGQLGCSMVVSRRMRGTLMRLNGSTMYSMMRLYPRKRRWWGGGVGERFIRRL